ncbi:uncharacterized protein LOC133817299 [Humulus lupulus]|uniref:uncharacterized protein LOC133817299 n=1 Tax=Humulus lupulus TaxID=3486 RepID=UPI002B40CA6A|nr:uncharacterized protein LOC133817299 [Humulus lupulus]
MAVADAAPLPPPSTTTSLRVSPKTVEKAVKALLKWKISKSDVQKPQLLDEDEFVYLILTLKKIPAKDRVNAYKVPLAHSLYSESSELCLIIDDGSKSGLTKDDAVKKIKSEGIPVSKVIKLSKLKSDYKAFEAKRKLCDSYALFLADKRVVPLLPRLLGKQFFKKKKIPVPVDLKHKNWKEQIEKACSSAMLFLRTGTCCVVRVAKASMSSDDIVENAVAAINGIVEFVPRKWGNVRSFHLKLLESVALPLYQALPDMKLKIEGVKAVVEEKVEKEGGDKKVVKEDKVGKKKGRIHEVRYMDVSAGEGIDEDDVLDSDVEVSAGVENDVTGSGELGKKKRKKGEEVKEDEVLAEKPLKKSAKAKVKAKDEDELSAKGKKKDGTVKKKKADDSPIKVVKGGESDGRKEKKLKSGETKLKATKRK